MREMVARGHVIGSHSYSHPKRMGGCPPETIAEEWRRSVDVLQDVLGAPILTASVPGGFYTRPVGVHAAAAGIRVLFTSAPTTRAHAVDGCRVLGRYTLRRWSAPAYAAGARRRRLAPRAGQWALYSTLDLLRHAAGDHYTTHPADVLGETRMTPASTGPTGRGYTGAAAVMTPPSGARPAPLSLLVALAIFAAHAALFGGWIVDDAGITFAYARNLASGQGIVAQPGVPPVEGYSNPTWMFVSAAAYALHLFVLPWTPKVLAAGVRRRGVRRHVARPRAARGGALDQRRRARPARCLQRLRDLDDLRARERAARAWPVALSASLAIQAVERPGEVPRRDVAAGVVAALLALTRPDALLYAGGYPIALAVAALLGRPIRILPAVRAVARMLAGFLPVFAGYLAFRFLYFGDWVPNTFHAKVKPAGASVLDPGKLLDLVEGAAGDFLFPAVLLLAGGAAWRAWRRRLPGRTIVLGVHLAIAMAIYMVMPVDWMGEFRFATPFFLFFFWFGGEAASRRWRTRCRAPPGAARLTAVVAAIFVVQAGIIFLRPIASLRAPIRTVPLTVATRVRRPRLQRLATARCRGRPASLLTPTSAACCSNSRAARLRPGRALRPVIARTPPRAARGAARLRARRGAADLHPHAGRLHASVGAPRRSSLCAATTVPLYEVRLDPDWVRLWRGETVPPLWATTCAATPLRAPTALAALQETYRQEGLRATGRGCGRPIGCGRAGRRDAGRSGSCADSDRPALVPAPAANGAASDAKDGCTRIRRELSEDQQRLQAGAIEFARAALTASGPEDERAGALRPRGLEEMRRLRRARHADSRGVRRPGLGLSDLLAVMEGLGYGTRDQGLLFSLNAHLWTNSIPILIYGTEEQKPRYLPGLCDGSLIGANAASEPDAGSDIFSMRTRAVRDGDHYVLNGTKTFVTNAPVADLFVAYATIDPALGATGITGFIVERETPGLTSAASSTRWGCAPRRWPRSSSRTAASRSTSRLGREGRGAEVFECSMEWERGCILASCLGVDAPPARGVHGARALAQAVRQGRSASSSRSRTGSST